jgi:hypothetical protein
MAERAGAPNPYARGMSARRLRIITIALFAAAAVFTGFAGDEGGPLLAASFACFSVGLFTFFRWRRALRATVFAREEKTADEAMEAVE